MAWLLAFVLVASICASIGGLLWFTRHIDRPHDHSPRPRWYRGRHRNPGPHHPAWLAMQRVDEAQVVAEVEQGMAAIEAMLEEQSR